MQYIFVIIKLKMKKKKKKEIKIRKPVPKKPGSVIRSKKDREKSRRVKHKDLIEDKES